MKIILYTIFAAFILTLTSTPVFGQFEGKVTYNSYEINAGGEKKNSDRFTMFVTPERILLQGENKYELMGSIKTEGVLVRLDFEDFVFLTGEDRALKISKSDITSLISMFGNGGDPQVDTEVGYKRTGETKKISGYDCEKFVFSDKEKPDNYAEVWMTKELPIEWGMLAESWSSATNGLIGGDVPVDLIFKDGYMPLKMDSYNAGALRSVTEAEEISASSVARGMVQIPSGIKILSFQDYLFQKMSEQ